MLEQHLHAVGAAVETAADTVIGAKVGVEVAPGTVGAVVVA